MGIILELMDAIMNGPEGSDYASITIAGLDPMDSSKIYKANGANLSERAFQYWPETISDSIEVGWEFKAAGGASSALASWSSNGGRTISFEVVMARFMKQRNSLSLVEKIGLNFLVQPTSSAPLDQKPHNVDIVDQIRYLRAFCYPTYLSLDGVVSAAPPPIAILNVPGVGLNESGGDAIFAVMTGCDVNYMLLFPDGTPRRASVSLTFKQVVQTTSGVRFKGFGSAPAPYQLPAVVLNADTLDRNAGRGTSGVQPGDVK